MAFWSLVSFPFDDAHKWFTPWIILLSLNKIAFMSKLGQANLIPFTIYIFHFFLFQKITNHSDFVYFFVCVLLFVFFFSWILKGSFCAKWCLEHPRMSIVTRNLFCFPFCLCESECGFNIQSTLTNTPNNIPWWTTNTHLVW